MSPLGCMTRHETRAHNHQHDQRERELFFSSQKGSSVLFIFFSIWSSPPPLPPRRRRHVVVLKAQGRVSGQRKAHLKLFSRIERYILLRLNYYYQTRVSAAIMLRGKKLASRMDGSSSRGGGSYEILGVHPYLVSQVGGTITSPLLWYRIISLLSFPALNSEGCFFWFSALQQPFTSLILVL